MKNNHLAFSVLLSALAAAAAFGAPLTETTAVHTKPDAASPTISYLKAGTEPTPAGDASVSAPAGWMAVELPGPFQGYVQTKDLLKQLDVKPGTPIRLSPETDGAVLTVAERGDKTTITGLRGRWTQISLNKSLVGYIRSSGSANAPLTIATAPAPGGAMATEPAPFNTAPVAQPNNLPGQPAPASALEDSARLPRQLTGKFVSTRSLLHPRRPYDWALEDNSGRRFAYLDISKLLLTDRLEKYIGHFVVVFGAAKPVPNTEDIVIQVESLQLLMK
jgi:hypothetical protein